VHVSIGPAFVDEMRALDVRSRRIVIAAMREIEADPWSPLPKRWELPPMWRPGTYCQSAGPFVITYCRDGDDGESLRFLHVRRPTFGSPDAM